MKTFTFYTLSFGKVVMDRGGRFAYLTDITTKRHYQNKDNAIKDAEKYLKKIYNTDFNITEKDFGKPIGYLENEAIEITDWIIDFFD